MAHSERTHARVAYLRNRTQIAHHEEVTHCAIASRIAQLKGVPLQPFPAAAEIANGRSYWVPAETVLDLRTADDLGIVTESDLFGGVVPFAFAASKAITQPALSCDAAVPEGWSHAFGDDVADAVLQGFSAFSRADALAAGRILIDAFGAARVKAASAAGGRGQTVAASMSALEDQIRSFDPDELARVGVVLEQNLTDVRTVSVGQVRVGGIIASYWGEQRLTPDNDGNTVYGGSSLFLVRGDFDALLAGTLPGGIGIAIAQARRYDAAIDGHYTGAFASRRNYDVAQGFTNAQWRSGVLEQSWRIGGASGAEVAALEAFNADPALHAVSASTVELYGAAHEPPPGAAVYFHGEDPIMGPMLKYAIRETP